MNSSDKKSPGVKGAPQRLKQAARPHDHFKPTIAQSKNPGFAQNVRRPVAPPVFQPLKQSVAQAKTASAAHLRTFPMAPPPYRPQPVPLVLQRKKNNAGRLVQLSNKALLPVASQRHQETVGLRQTGSGLKTVFNSRIVQRSAAPKTAIKQLAPLPPPTGGSSSSSATPEGKALNSSAKSPSIGSSSSAAPKKGIKQLAPSPPPT